MADAGYVLSADKVGKTFKGFRALYQVNLKVRAGSIHGLIGPNGAGKSTLLNDSRTGATRSATAFWRVSRSPLASL